MPAAASDTFHVERSISIKAPPEAIFPLINDFHQWALWSPYDRLDPAMAKTYSGPAQGVGSGYGWESKGKAGVGSMLITEASAPTRVSIALEFAKPFKASNTANFTLRPEGATTRVTWAMDGPTTLMSRVMGLFLSMDKLVGKDFEAGLAALKAQAET